MVAWISCKSIVGADVGTVRAADSVTEDIGDPFKGPGARHPDPERTIRGCGYEILSRNSSTAFPTFSSRFVSATVRLGDATYQVSAGIWKPAMKSLALGLLMPGQPSRLQKIRSIASGIFVTKSSM